VKRSLVLLLTCLSLMIAGGWLTLASSLAAQRSRRLVICPVVAGGIGPCCGPPLSQANAAAEPVTCCPPNAAALCVPSLTISSSPNPSRSSAAVVISGQLLGAGASSIPVVLWQELAGERQFERLLQTTTDAGSYTITRDAGRVQTNREWYVTADGMQSGTIKQSVEADVTLKLVRAAAGKPMTFTGRVTPSHTGELVLLQRRVSHGWRTIARSRLNRASEFTLVRRMPKGTIELHAILPADSDNARSASASLTVHVP